MQDDVVFVHCFIYYDARTWHTSSQVKEDTERERVCVLKLHRLYTYLPLTVLILVHVYFGILNSLCSGGTDTNTK